jgi:hypothetical protein
MDDEPSLESRIARLEKVTSKWISILLGGLIGTFLIAVIAMIYAGVVSIFCLCRTQGIC